MMQSGFVLKTYVLKIAKECQMQPAHHGRWGWGGGGGRALNNWIVRRGMVRTGATAGTATTAHVPEQVVALMVSEPSRHIGLGNS